MPESWIITYRPMEAGSVTVVGRPACVVWCKDHTPGCAACWVGVKDVLKGVFETKTPSCPNSRPEPPAR